MNRSQHHLILISLASLTCLFLGAAAYTLWALPQPQMDRMLGMRPSFIRNVPDVVNLTVQETGITAVSLTELRAHNFLVNDLSANQVQLSHNGRLVPFYVLNDEADQQLLFFAEAISHTLDVPTVYQLRLGKGVAMAELDAAPTRPGSDSGVRQIIWEENKLFLPEATSNDPWYGRLLQPNQPVTIPLHKVPLNSNGSLQIQLWSNSQSDQYPDHHVQIGLNGRELINWKWDGIGQQTITVAISANQLADDGANELSVVVPANADNGSDAIYLDWVRFHYETTLYADATSFWFYSDAENVTIHQPPPSLLLFDLSDEENPVLLRNYQQSEAEMTFAGNGLNGRYYAVSPQHALRPSISSFSSTQPPLRQADRGADYIIIYPDDSQYLAALRPLIDQRQAQGLRVTAVSLGQIGHEFGYGRASAAAIRSFLAYAQTHWQAPAPHYLLLAADASYDTHNWLQSNQPNLIPTHYLFTPENGYLSNDSWLATFGNNVAPQMAVGRFPAINANDLSQMVAKTIAFEQNSGSWQQDALFVADDDPYFEAYTQQLRTNLEANDFTVYALHMSQNDSMHNEVLGRMTRGVGLVNYIGNGDAQMWGNGAVLQAEDARLLSNNGRPAIFTTFTCQNALFTDPQAQSLGEALLAVENGGAVAVVAPTTHNQQTSQALLADRFYAELLKADTLGQALWRTKTSAANDPQLQDATYMLHLLGDPALQLYRP